MKKSEALKILGLSEGASDEDVKKAHRKLVIENHPDKFGQDPQRRAEAEEKTKLINEARDVLINRSWEPEYATAGTPYGALFSYSPIRIAHEFHRRPVCSVALLGIVRMDHLGRKRASHNLHGNRHRPLRLGNVRSLRRLPRHGDG